MKTTKQQFLRQLDEILSINGINGFYNEQMKLDWINEGGRRVVNYHNWNTLKHAVRTQSEKDQEWYLEPEEFKPASIFRITMGMGDDEVEHTLVSWDEYKEKRNSGIPIAALLGNQYFIAPVPKEDNLIIGVYGILKWKELVEDDDQSVLGKEFDEAILKYALSMAYLKELNRIAATSVVNEVENVILAKLLENEQQEIPKVYLGKLRASKFN